MVCFYVCAFLELYLCLFLFFEGCSKYKAKEKRILKDILFVYLSFLFPEWMPFSGELNQILIFGVVFLIFKAEFVHILPYQFSTMVSILYAIELDVVSSCKVFNEFDFMFVYILLV